MSRKRIFYILFFVVLFLSFVWAMSMVIPGFTKTNIPPISQVTPFRFTTQDSTTFTEKDIQGKVAAVEYFFTTCGTICPKMNIQMQRVQKAFLNDERVKLLSFTVDPETDSVAQMRQYADAHGANPGQWHFLTGDKKELYSLARKSFFVLKPAEAQNLGDAGSDFIHTNNFVLVDEQQRIRGYYDGTSEHSVDELIHDIQLLLDEK